MPTRIKAVFGAVTALVAATISFTTAFDLVHWTAKQTALTVTESGAVLGLIAALVADRWPATKKEPVALAATFTAAVSATLALGTGFRWWHFSSDQVSVLVALTTAIIGVGAALLARSQVTADAN